MNLQRSRPPVLQQVPAAENVAPEPPSPARHTTAAGGAEQPLVRLDILRALELHRKLALAFAISGLVLAVAYAARTWPVYKAQSQIYIQPTSAKILDQGNNAQRWPYDSNSYDSFILQQVQLASNPDVLANAMHKLPAGSWQQAEESEQAAAERLGRALKVERLGSSYQVAITAQAKSAEMAAQIANAVANSIVEKAAHEANAGDPQRLTILQGERERVQNQLNADLAEQDALNKQLGMAAVGTEAPDLIDNAIGSTREELIKARTDHDEAEARFAAMGGGKGTSSAALDAEADELVASDAGLTSMKTSLNARRATLITQMANLTPNNPEYKLDAQELSKINSSLDAMMQDLRAKAAARIQERLRTDLVRTAGVEAQLNGQLRQLAASAASATPKLQRANDLATDIVRLRSRYAAVDEELHDIMLQDSVPGAVHLSVAAVPPLHPTLSGILRKSVPMALGGILLGLLAALLANHLDPRIYIGSDVEHLLGFAPMVALPDFAEVSEAVFEEHILRLSTAIEHARRQGALCTCIFTGSGPATGVTTVVTRVRDMLAAMGRPTVLVNATGAAGSTGTAHPAPRSAPEMQINGAAETFEPESGTRSLALLRRMTEESGSQDESLVLADTAPLLISAETEYLARFVDCAIVVVESGVTTRAELRATADALQRLNVSALGLVLNRVGLAKADAAFRKSVRGVEGHVSLQGRASQRTAPRNRRHAAEAPPAPVAQHHQPVASPQHAETDAAQAAAQIGAERLMRERVAAQRVAAEKAAAEQAAVDRAIAERVMPEPASTKHATVEPAALERAAADQVELERAALERAIAECVMEEPFAAPQGVEADAPEFAPQFPHQQLPHQQSAHRWFTAPVGSDAAPLSLEPPVQPAWEALLVAQETVAREPQIARGPQLARGPEITLQPEADRNLPWWLSEKPLTTSELAELASPAGAGGGEKPAWQPGLDQPARVPVSRLSGLRNVLFGTGGRDLQKREAEVRDEPAFPEPALTPFAPQPSDPEPEATVIEATYTEPAYTEPAYTEPACTPAPEPIPMPAAAPSEPVAEPDDLRVVAAPEILPPQPIAAPRSRPDVWESDAGSASGRLDRRDTLDDIQVLPSRRGQYRRKG